MKKVTMQDIADKVQVSRVTVSKVMNHNQGVSAALEQKIIKTANQLGYGKRLEQQELSVPVSINIGIAVARPAVSGFWLDLINAIATRTADYKMNLLYTYLPSVTAGKMTFPASFYDGTLDGLIVLNVYDEDTYDRLHDLELVKVFLDSPTGFNMRRINGDVIYIAGRAPIKKIVKGLIGQGYDSIGFIGDIGYAANYQDRYDGYIDALDEAKMTLKPEICFLEVNRKEEIKKQIDGFLDGLIEERNLPPVFVCVNDLVAHQVIDLLAAKSYRVPEDIIVTGFGGERSYTQTNKNLKTTVQIDIEAIADKLVRQIKFRLEEPKAPYEVSYISASVVEGGN